MKRGQEFNRGKWVGKTKASSAWVWYSTSDQTFEEMCATFDTMYGATAVKFNKHNVTNTATGAKCRVFYSLDNHVSRLPCVTIFAKDCLERLQPVFAGAVDVQNDSDGQTDYFENDRVRLFEEHPLYLAARTAVESRMATTNLG